MQEKKLSRIENCYEHHGSILVETILHISSPRKVPARNSIFGRTVPENRAWYKDRSTTGRKVEEKQPEQAKPCEPYTSAKCLHKETSWSQPDNGAPLRFFRSAEVIRVSGELLGEAFRCLVGHLSDLAVVLALLACAML